MNFHKIYLLKNSKLVLLLSIYITVFLFAALLYIETQMLHIHIVIRCNVRSDKDVFFSFKRIFLCLDFARIFSIIKPTFVIYGCLACKHDKYFQNVEVSCWHMAPHYISSFWYHFSWDTTIINSLFYTVCFLCTGQTKSQVYFTFQVSSCVYTSMILWSCITFIQHSAKNKPPTIFTDTIIIVKMDSSFLLHSPHNEGWFCLSLCCFDNTAIISNCFSLLKNL